MSISKERSIDWSDETDDTTWNIISAVASFKGVDPVELSPIYEDIDPEALDSLVNGNPGTYCQIGFEYCGVRVEIDSTGACSVSELTEG